MFLALKAHAIATVCLSGLMVIYMYVMKDSTTLPNTLEEVSMHDILRGIQLISLVTGAITLPLGLLVEYLMRKAGYKSFLEYLMVGFITGMLIAIVTQGILVNPTPLIVDANGNSDLIYLQGIPLKMRYIQHYIQFTVVALVYANCYYIFTRKK